MNAPERAGDWSEANQALVVAELARLRALLGDGDAEGAAAEIEARRAGMPGPAAIDTLAHLFQLSGFERDVLLLAAGVEMDAHLAAACAARSGPPHGPWASFGLALAALPDAHWSALAPTQPLRRWRLVELDEGAGITTARLRLDERVLHFIAGLNELDPRLRPLLEPVPRADALSDGHAEMVGRAIAHYRGHPGRMPPLLLTGDDAAGQQDAAATIAERLGLGLCRLNAADIPTAAAERDALATLWRREAVLLGCGLLITHEDGEGQAPLARFVARLDGLVIVAGRDAVAIECDCLRESVDRPDTAERRRLWRAALGSRADALGPAVDSLADHYRLGAHRIAALAARTEGLAAADALDFLHRASREEAAPMPSLAQRIEARASWADLVLPQTQRHALEQIVVHARHRAKVHYDWGFAGKSARGLGIATLFWGDSGTGKTLAAEVLASELELALYRVDLSAVVSKYIGETEKNLRKVFDAAEDGGAILLFDEADALFGKRSEVKDSHDRYANIEVSYLLQRMEAYRGLAILTTNHKAALDAAFQRRLRFVVHFPFPDQTQREAIWRAVLPAEAPLNGVDYAKLARLSVAGGTIRNIALTAAFLAAEDDRSIGMAQLLRAAHLEAAKQDKPYSDAETRGWV